MNSGVKRGNFMELLTCTIVSSDKANNYANTQNGRLQSTAGCNLFFFFYFQLQGTYLQYLLTNNV